MNIKHIFVQDYVFEYKSPAETEGALKFSINSEAFSLKKKYDNIKHCNKTFDEIRPSRISKLD